MAEEWLEEIAIEMQIRFKSLWDMGICVDARRALMGR
jgi:hypothetical protein